MLRIRRFEDKAAELYTAHEIRGFLHLYNGEEAVAVGVMEALTLRTPWWPPIASMARRCAGAFRRLDTRRDVRKQERLLPRPGGSMHLFDDKTRFYGAMPSSGAVCAWPLAWRWPTRCRQAARHLLLFRDGAVAEGEFHESMNLAALWQLRSCFCAKTTFYAWARP